MLSVLCFPQILSVLSILNVELLFSAVKGSIDFAPVQVMQGCYWVVHFYAIYTRKYPLPSPSSTASELTQSNGFNRHLQPSSAISFMFSPVTQCSQYSQCCIIVFY